MFVQCHVDFDVNENVFINLFYAQENIFDLIFLRNHIFFDNSFVVSNIIIHYCNFSFKKNRNSLKQKILRYQIFQLIYYVKRFLI